MAGMQTLILKVSESSNVKVKKLKKQFQNYTRFSKIRQKTLEFATGNGYSHGVMTPITNPIFKREYVNEELAEKHLNFTRSPMILESFEWRFLTPVISVQNLSANDKDIAKNNELQFIQELKFAYHIKDAGYILIQLGNNDPEVLGKLVKRILKPAYDTRILLEVPMVVPEALMATYRSDIPEDFEAQDPVCSQQYPSETLIMIN